MHEVATASSRHALTYIRNIRLSRMTLKSAVPSRICELYVVVGSRSVWLIFRPLVLAEHAHVQRAREVNVQLAPVVSVQ